MAAKRTVPSVAESTQLELLRAELERLASERDAAFAREAAMAEVLRVINSSSGDPQPVFEAILEKAHTLCGANHGTLCIRQGDLYPAIAIRGVPEPFATQLRHGLGPDAPAIRHLLAGNRYLHIPDMTKFGHPLARVAEAAGVRTLLSVPLLKDGLVGAIMAARYHEVRPFSDQEIALLENFAAQAVIAMENARLITETREALEQQTATAEVLGVINSSPGDLTPVFDAMLERALRLCDASLGVLYTYDGQSFQSVRHQGVSAELAEFLREPRGKNGLAAGGSFLRLVTGEEVIHETDLLNSEAYRRGIPLRRALVDLEGAQSLLYVALRSDTHLLGAIVIYRKEVRPFTDKQIALLRNFAAQAVIAIENARLLGELQRRTEEVAELNRGLEVRVAEQVEELGRVGRLKRFLAPQLAELIVSQGDEKILESHRREIVVVFCDLRGYTAFTETAEPEEVLDFLREYHGALGPLVSQYEGTLDQFSGDGIMVFFNDPVPIPNPAERAVNMAMAMREAAGRLTADWRERGRDLGFGAGIAQGYATLGQIGFSERSGYTAIGTVCNVAARLCSEAKDGQILLSQRINVALKGSVVTEQIGALALKGLTQPVVTYNVPLTVSQPTLRLVEGGPPSD